MEIIVKFLEAMQLLLLAKVALFLVIGLGLGIAGFVTHRYWLVAVGAVVALGQFAWPWLSNRHLESEIAERREYVRTLPKVALPADYPRRLVIEGDLSPNPPGWFIAAGYFDEVDVGGRRWITASSSSACREAALAILDPDRPGERRKFGANPYQRVKDCVVDAGPALDNAEAIVLRVDGRTTLYDRKNARLQGRPRSIQLSVRGDGKEELVHYDEMPTLAYPKSATRLLPEGYDYPCSRFAYLQIVANVLDAAKVPAQAEGIRRRGAVRRSEYDDCIASIAPWVEAE